MGSREVKAAAAGDAASTGKVLSHELRESGVVEIDENSKQKYSRRKKKIPKRCPLLTLSNRTSRSVIVEALDDQLARIESDNLDDNESGDGSTSNLNSCAFPYYRSWCRGHCQDAVLVKDACVSCTALSPNVDACEPKKSKGSSLERKLIKQLKTEYKDLSAITRKISAYTKDILSSITTRTGYLTLGIVNATGNAGLKDVVLGLKWVKANIEKFGGNPNNITILGASSGGATVDYFVLLDSAAGIFHATVDMSGSVLGAWAFQIPAKALSQTERLADLMGLTWTAGETRLFEILPLMLIELTLFQ